MNKPWAMLATPLESVEHLDYPYLAQPKLNGIRAKWTGTQLVSRQNKVWKPQALPHIYDKLIRWSVDNPGVVLDGELYAHGMSFQDIEARCAVKRVSPHPGAMAIDYHAFDIINSGDTESRQIVLSQIYKPWVAVCRIGDRSDLNTYMNTFIEYGYEGMIMRAYGCPYIDNRTEAMIKVKKLQFARVTVKTVNEGLGKFAGMMGSFTVMMDKIQFEVGGGNVTEEQRKDIWCNRDMWDAKQLYHLMMAPRKILISYRDTFNSGRPVQPLIVKLS